MMGSVAFRLVDLESAFAMGCPCQGRFIDEKGFERLVICRVSRDFLAAPCDMADASPEQLLGAYMSVRDEVNGIAARQLAAGEHKPSIRLEHFLREKSHLSTPKSKKGK
jgi:hypothetical protein